MCSLKTFFLDDIFFTIGVHIILDISFLVLSWCSEILLCYNKNDKPCMYSEGEKQYEFKTSLFFIQTIFYQAPMHCRERLYNETMRKVQYGLTRIVVYDRLRNIKYYLAISFFVPSVILDNVFYIHE